MEYFFTWFLYYLAAISLIALCVYPIRRHRIAATFVVGMGILLCLIPWTFDPSHSAPLFVVMAFQLLLERDADIADVMTMFVMGTGAVILLCAVLFVYAKFSAIWSSVRKRLSKR